MRQGLAKRLSLMAWKHNPELLAPVRSGIACKCRRQRKINSRLIVSLLQTRLTATDCPWPSWSYKKTEGFRCCTTSGGRTPARAFVMTTTRGQRPTPSECKTWAASSSSSWAVSPWLSSSPSASSCGSRGKTRERIGYVAYTSFIITYSYHKQDLVLISFNL